MTESVQKGILLVNLGSPASPKTADIRKYLREFLSDKRVMTMPAPLRWILVNLIIVPFRPRVIREKYQSIWGEDGFPLLRHGNALTGSLSGHFGEKVAVELAMRYGEPSLSSQLSKFRQKGVKKLLVAPLFPQYSSATTGSIVEKVLSIIKDWPVIPELQTISHFYSHPAFISAWVAMGQPYLDSKPDHVLFSFHGLPESHILEGDITKQHCLKKENCCAVESGTNTGCYRRQCFRTAYLIAGQLGLSPDQFSISFQSRLGRTKWLEPYTTDKVRELADKGIKNLLVFCPSFVADCLETTVEIDEEIKEEYLSAGGKSLTLVPSLNSDEIWTQSLSQIIREKL